MKTKKHPAAGRERWDQNPKSKALLHSNSASPTTGVVVTRVNIYKYIYVYVNVYV